MTSIASCPEKGCLKEIAADIIDGEEESLRTVKENPPNLCEDIGRPFDEALEPGEPGGDFTACQTEEVRGGRGETGTCYVISYPRGARDARLWVGLTAIVMVISHREVDGVSSDEIRSFRVSAAGTAKDQPRWARGHCDRDQPALAVGRKLP